MLNIPDYYKVIDKPMDLSTVKRKLEDGEYEAASEFEADVRFDIPQLLQVQWSSWTELSGESDGQTL